MSPERIYLRHYNDSQTSPIDPHTLRLWRLGDGDIEYVRADLAAPAEPDHIPPHLLPFTDQTCWQQRDDLVREVLGLLEKIKSLEAELETARRPTPSLAAGPDAGKWIGLFANKDLAEEVIRALEGVREVRDGDTEEPAKRCDQCGRLFAEHATGPENGSVVCLETYEEIRAELIEERAEVDALQDKVESLEAEVKKREQQIADFARRTGDDMECLRAKLRALEGAAVELERLRKIEAIVTNPLFQRFMNEASQGLAALQNQQEKK